MLKSRLNIKKLMSSKLVVTALLGVVLSGCVTGNASREDKMANGAAFGALVGGFTMYNIVGSGGNYVWLMTLLGGAAGGGAGYLIMDEVTAHDRQEMEGTIYRALTEGETGQTMTWQAADQEMMGHFTPVRTFMNGTGQICRDLMAETIVDGEKRYGTQTMCKNGAGHWVAT
ncbi:hypothetical protein [Curvivirga sp.]|uniref:hypothetical protein n=1 Tax=Curvivirga sp. TaxID=2856848 RepID=UPI003B58F597